MTDPRTTPDPLIVKQDKPARIIHPVTDLLRHPGHTRDRQVLFGDRLRILGGDGSYAYAMAEKDGYIGFVDVAAVGPDYAVTHRISALGTQAYAEPDMKSADQITLHHGSLINVLDIENSFAKTNIGYVPIQHITPMDCPCKNIIDVAKLYLGTPYLWGGNSRLGIDCSGLIQAACIASGLPCPGDSDQQQNQLGTLLNPGTTKQKNDLLFWKGHVALVVSETTLIHANAHHMMVTFETIDHAIKRIQDQGDGPVTAHTRLAVSSG